MLSMYYFFHPECMKQIDTTEPFNSDQASILDLFFCIFKAKFANPNAPLHDTRLTLGEACHVPSFKVLSIFLLKHLTQFAEHWIEKIRFSHGECRRNAERKLRNGDKERKCRGLTKVSWRQYLSCRLVGLTQCSGCFGRMYTEFRWTGILKKEDVDEVEGRLCWV